MCAFQTHLLCSPVVREVVLGDVVHASRPGEMVFKSGKKAIIDFESFNIGTGESVKFMLDPGNYTGHVLFFFENGKAARIELSAYATKTNRKKLTGAYSGSSPLVSIVPLANDTEIAVYSTEGRVIIFSTSLLTPKTTRSTVGVAVMTLKKKNKLCKAVPVLESSIKNLARYRVRSVPAAGALLKEEDLEEQQIEIQFV